ncbi:MAG: hypothetical protein UT32_C0001G0121 [Parcubacteria group bacterium GW2011_GWC2_39_14]|nr:MAG: hypothetical protein UT32_C0001G0121 [Parcubacteria group bacterium GW2011_GWC2_39_14]KKR55545.1 MAG: hypothetical protein UT91_C0001G0120 [Parcubacteria group bacterium GW2011_GWA2_40_23]
MENVIKSTPKDVFLHLFNIVTFYLSVIGFIMLFINYINALFPDALNYYFSNISNAVKVSSSILFIAVPAYLLSAWILGRDLKNMPEKRDFWLRKWLVYFTLFVSAITIIVDLMIFVYNFLDGDLTVKFILKVCIVLIVTAAVFGYYIWDLKRKEMKSKLPKILAIVLAVVVLASIIMGFFIIGTPSQQRNRKMDDQRIMDLQTIQGQVVDYWSRKEVLPKNLEGLEDNISGFIVPKDPDTKKAYEYNINDPLKFELCADFATSSLDLPARGKETMYDSPYGAFQQNWDHQIGRTCFSRTIDPELYKLNTSEPKVLR